MRCSPVQIRELQSLRLQVTHLQEALDAERAESARRLENIQALRLELDTARKDTERARLEVLSPERLEFLRVFAIAAIHSLPSEHWSTRARTAAHSAHGATQLRDAQHAGERRANRVARELLRVREGGRTPAPRAQGGARALRESETRGVQLLRVDAFKPLNLCYLRILVHILVSCLPASSSLYSYCSRE